MPTMKVVDMTGKETGSIELLDSVFAAEVNESVLHSVIRAYLLNQRQGTQSTKTRAEVSGGGKKPWRQKGTGRARQGSTRSPQWTHGGIALGPKPRLYKVSINKKVKKIAICSALSDKLANDKLISMLPDFVQDEYRTLIEVPSDSYEHTLIKAADKLAAYIKCVEELRSGNKEFSKAESTLKKELAKYFEYEEVKYFYDTFAPSFKKTLDELE